MKRILKAPAKINLYLRVNGKREDGYHDLSMIMQPISLFDTIEIEITSKKNIKPSEPKIVLRSNYQFIPTDDKNLVVKVVKYFFEKYNIMDHIYIYLKKMIPTCGGLGGGSSDAATMLMFLDEYYKTGLSKDELNNIAVKFGADIPFFIYKNECLCEGKGELITELKEYNKYYVLIVTPNIRVSTKDIFDTLDKMLINNNDLKFKDTKLNGCLEAIKNKNLKKLSCSIYNDLEDVTFRLYDNVRVMKECVLNTGAKGALMSGSGPTVFGIFDSYFKGLRARNEIKNKFKDAFVYLGKPI